MDQGKQPFRNCLVRYATHTETFSLPKSGPWEILPKILWCSCWKVSTEILCGEIGFIALLLTSILLVLNGWMVEFTTRTSQSPRSSIFKTSLPSKIDCCDLELRFWEDLWTKASPCVINMESSQKLQIIHGVRIVGGLVKGI